MTLTYGPFDGAQVAESGWFRWMRHNLPTGVVRDDLDEFEVFADSSGIQVKVRSGFAMIRGGFVESDIQTTVTLTTPHASLPRIDTIILKLDLTADTITLTKKDGTAAASPVAPTLLVYPDTSATVHEFPLADVRVNNGAVTIEANKVTDRRSFVTSATGSGGLTVIDRKILTGTGDIDFNLPIPAGYAGLRIVASLRGSTAATAIPVQVQFNNDSGANYYGVSGETTGGAAESFDPDDAVSSGRLGFAPAASATADRFASLLIEIPDYAGAFHKSASSQGGYSYGNVGGNQVMFRGHVTWNSLTAITRVRLFPTAGQWANGSRAYLYGYGV